MNNPRMIPAGDARAALNSAIQSSGYHHSFPDTYVRDLAHTVIEQSAQIERVRKALHKIERADEQAQHDWDTKADMYSQGAALGYSMAAQWLEEALGDTDDAANHTAGAGND